MGKSKKPGVIPTLGTYLPAIATTASSIKTGQGVEGAVINNVYNYTGYNLNTGKWEPGNATSGFIAVGSWGISMIGKKMGLNRYTPKILGYPMF